MVMKCLIGRYDPYRKYDAALTAFADAPTYPIKRNSSEDKSDGIAPSEPASNSSPPLSRNNSKENTKFLQRSRNNSKETVGVSRSNSKDNSKLSRNNSKETDVGSASPHSSPEVSAPKRPKSLTRVRGGSKEDLRVEPMSPEVLRLEELIANHPPSRRSLVNLLMPIKADYSIKVRFCCAVSELETLTLSKQERTARQRKIIAMFVQNGSMFQITGIPPTLEKYLLAAKFEYLTNLKHLCLEELSRNDVVKGFLNKETVTQTISSRPKIE